MSGSRGLRLERDRVYGQFASPEGHSMVVKATNRGIRAQVLLNHAEGPVIAEIHNPLEPQNRTVKFRPLWQRNSRRWKDSVSSSAGAVLDRVVTAVGEQAPAGEQSRGVATQPIPEGA